MIDDLNKLGTSNHVTAYTDRVSELYQLVERLSRKVDLLEQAEERRQKREDGD